MFDALVADLVPGEDVCDPSDDPLTREVGYSVVKKSGDVIRHYVRLVSLRGSPVHPSIDGLLGSQEGRAEMAAFITRGIPRHGHGWSPDPDCHLCLASEVMES